MYFCLCFVVLNSFMWLFLIGENGKLYLGENSVENEC